MSHSRSPATWELPSPIIISPLAAEQHHWSDGELTAELKDDWPIFLSLSLSFLSLFLWAEGISYSFSTLQSQNQFSKLCATTYFPSICSRSEWRRGSGMRRGSGRSFLRLSSWRLAPLLVSSTKPQHFGAWAAQLKLFVWYLSLDTWGR